MAFKLPFIAYAFFCASFVYTEDCGDPAFFLNIDISCTELDMTNFEYVPNVRVAYQCKTLLVRTSAKIDYCPVEVCSNGNWSDASISCGSTECYETSGDYKGRRTCTKTGKTCQRWDYQTPNAHNFTDDMFPDDNATQAKNYCRDPGSEKGQPWCFTTDPGTSWEYCNIPECTAINITHGTCPENYCGDILTGISTDNTCLQLAPVSGSYSRYVGSTVSYKCVSLLKDFQSSISYCPVRTCQEDFFWNNVSLSCAENECYTPGDSGSYSGRRECTVNGRMCQDWHSQTPHTHPYTLLTEFPDADDTARAAHCRDPGNVRGQPWCYTTDPDVEWEYCGLPKCTDMVSNSGTCDDAISGDKHNGDVIKLREILVLYVLTDSGVVTESNIVATTTGSAVTTTTSTLTSALVTMVTSPVTTTTATTTTTTTGTTTTTTPFVSQKRSILYEKIPARAGFELQTTVSYLSTATSCCRECSETNSCVLVTYNGGKCNLYMQNSANNDTLNCSLPQKCYLIQPLV